MRQHLLLRHVVLLRKSKQRDQMLWKRTRHQGFSQFERRRVKSERAYSQRASLKRSLSFFMHPPRHLAETLVICSRAFAGRGGFGPSCLDNNAATCCSSCWIRCSNAARRCSVSAWTCPGSGSARRRFVPDWTCPGLKVSRSETAISQRLGCGWYFP